MNTLGYRKIVIKVGTNVLTNADGHLNFGVMQNLVYQIAGLQRNGIKVTLVTSGAMAAGRSIISSLSTKREVSRRQVLAAAGQVKLISIYNEILKEYGLHSAQVLATKEDFRDSSHRRNLKSCLIALMRERLLPIVNENDTVAIAELMFTDNDELASSIALLLNADALFILTNVDGIYTGNPYDEKSTLLSELSCDTDDVTAYIQEETSAFGRGGMQSKAKMAFQTARAGIIVHIANGTRQNVVLDIIEGRKIGTVIRK